MKSITGEVGHRIVPLRMLELFLARGELLLVQSEVCTYHLNNILDLEAEVFRSEPF